MIIMSIIAVWVVGSVAFLLALAGAAGRPLPEPEFEVGLGLNGEPADPEAEPAGVRDLRPAAA